MAADEVCSVGNISIWVATFSVVTNLFHDEQRYQQKNTLTMKYFINGKKTFSH